jgi:tetratricopeptide (TPR) repeat protein
MRAAWRSVRRQARRGGGDGAAYHARRVCPEGAARIEDDTGSTRHGPAPESGARARRLLALAWAGALAVPAGVRLWNACAGPLMWGYDAWGHVAYVLFIDRFRGLPWPDQGWSYFHPPLHYLLGWLLAQPRDADVLARGLAILGSLASLATAGLAALATRLASPDRPLLAPLAFAAVALLPVHLYLSPMPGNELTLTLIASAALLVFAANECRERPRLALDAVAGLLAGLALLTKFSGLLPVVTAVAALAARVAIERGGVRRAAARAGVIAGVALAVAGPYYQRNLAAFGTPFKLSRDFPLVAQVEAEQTPGVRRPADYLRLPLAVFTDPRPQAPAMQGSVWGTVYAAVWADVFRESDVERATVEHASAGFLTALGLLPTALFVAGAGLAIGDVRRGRRRGVYVPLLAHAAVVVASFAVFAWRVPIWSALKASYLLGLSLPYGVFLARAAERLGGAPRGVRAAVAAWLAAAGLAAAVAASEGALYPRRSDAPATAALRFQLGDLDGARRVFARLAAGAPYPVPWLDGLGAIALAEDRPDEARRLYARAVALEPAEMWNHVQRRGQLAVATALAGDLDSAAQQLDALLPRRDLPEARANRGALHAAAGELAAAERELGKALAANPDLVAARVNLAAVLDAAGRAAEARTAREEAAGRACRPPRGYPHGLGTGEVLEWGVGARALLLVDGDRLRLAPPDFRRRACRGLR